MSKKNNEARKLGNLYLHDFNTGYTEETVFNGEMYVLVTSLSMGFNSYPPACVPINQDGYRGWM